MPFPFFDETKELNELTRKNAAGSFISLSEGVTHYELGGDESGEKIVLVHGFSTPYFIFDTTYDFLVKSGCRVLRYDLFGRGLSDRPEVEYDIYLFVRQLKELCDALQFDQFALCGLSLGGSITASFIDNYPARVSRYILIDPAGAQRIMLSRLFEITKIPFVGEIALGFIGSASMVKGIANDLFTPKLVAVFQERYKVQMQYKGFKRAILSTIRNRMLESFYETYERVGLLKKPTLLLWGRQDKTVPFNNSKILCKAIPQAEFHAFDNCGHLPHYEKPEEVNNLLIKFLRGNQS
jgi:pimeloyl-ACP methyl ester carboxylesterase